ncbi:hypothetical protein [Lysobacter enzymogenes]|uniref:hypothetical protein n=1 Tax=Lysobacter enzymogenes TaxID=69 RepID=UPI000F4BE9A5|nr:hypothetical protein [Lysobacter enzymogenes]
MRAAADRAHVLVLRAPDDHVAAALVGIVRDREACCAQPLSRDSTVRVGASSEQTRIASHCVPQGPWRVV